MNVALVAGDQEVEELRYHQRLLPHRGTSQGPVPALMNQEPVGVFRGDLPHPPAREPDQVEDDRPFLSDVRVTDPGARAGQRVLVRQFLLELLQLLRAAQPLMRGPQRPHDRKGHIAPVHHHEHVSAH